MREVRWTQNLIEEPEPDLTLIPNDEVRTHADRSSINRARKKAGMREVSPPKDYRIGYRRITDFNQSHAVRGHTLPHNAKRIPKRKAKLK